MAELSNQLESSGGEPGTGIVRRHATTLTVRLLLTFVPAAVIYLLDLTTFWGGFAFFVVAESVRWLGTAVVIEVLRWRGASSSIANEILRPMIELAAIAIAPLFSLAILLSFTAPLLNRNVQTELTDSFILYLCYLPYALVSLLVFPLFKSRI